MPKLAVIAGSSSTLGRRGSASRRIVGGAGGAGRCERGAAALARAGGGRRLRGCGGCDPRSHRLMRGVQGARLMVGERGKLSAQAGAHARGAERAGEGIRADGRQGGGDAIAVALGLQLRAAGQHDGELFAPESADDGVGASGGAQHLGDTPQGAVAGHMPVAIVELLEVIEVDDHDREVAASRARVIKRALEGRHERAAIQQARERIGGGALQEGVAQALLVVAHQCHERGHEHGDADRADVDDALLGRRPEEQHGRERRRRKGEREREEPREWK